VQAKDLLDEKKNPGLVLSPEKILKNRKIPKVFLQGKDKIMDKIKLKFWWIIYKIINTLKLEFNKSEKKVWIIYYHYSYKIYCEWIKRDKS